MGQRYKFGTVGGRCFAVRVNDAYGGPPVPEGQRLLRLAGVAERQYGVFTRSQARAAGFSGRAIDRRLGAGQWVRIYEGVYRLPGTGPSWHQALTAALLWAGAGAVVSHRAAAALLQLDGAEPGSLEVSTDRMGRSPPAGLILHRTGKLPPYDRARVGTLPVTTVTRTLIDLGAVADEEAVERALDHALRRRLTSIPHLRRRLREIGGRGRAGTAVLRRLLALRDPRNLPPESVLEARLTRLLHSAALPPPLAQYRVRDQGRLVARVDFAYPEKMVAVEADGYLYHSGRAAWQHDLERRNRLTALGWRVVNVTWDDLVRRPQVIVDTVRRLLA